VVETYPEGRGRLITALEDQLRHSRAMVRSTHRRVDILPLRSSSHCSFVTGHRFLAEEHQKILGKIHGEARSKKTVVFLEEGEMPLPLLLLLLLLLLKGNGKVAGAGK